MEEATFAIGEARRPVLRVSAPAGPLQAASVADPTARSTRMRIAGECAAGVATAAGSEARTQAAEATIASHNQLERSIR